eukprot:PITA_10441
MGRCFALRDYNSNSKAKIAIFQLRDSALNWWGNLERQLHLTPDTVTWELFEERFRKKYLLAYYEEQQHQEDRFMYGLRPKIRAMVRMWKPSLVAEVVEQARYVEEHLDLKGEGRAIFPRQTGFMGKAPRTFPRRGSRRPPPYGNRVIPRTPTVGISMVSSATSPTASRARTRNNSFISPVALEKCGLAAYEHDDFKQAEGPSVDQCQVNLGVCMTKLKAYVTELGTYDVIFGMDWLEAHRALVDCFKKKVICLDDEGRPIEICGIKRGVSLRFISMMKVKRCLRRGCKLYLVKTVSDQKGPSLDQHPVLAEFKDVFPEELPGLPPIREIDFTIDDNSNI